MIRKSTNTKFSAFTLLELLVVLAVLGGMLSLVSFHYQTDDLERKITEESQQVRLFLQNTLDKAWLDGVTYGANISSKEMALFELKDGEWVSLSKRYLASSENIEWYLLEKSGFTNLSSEGRALVEKIDLVFASSGEYSPFELRIMITESSTQQTVKKTRVLTGDGANAFVFVAE
jgi:prepilin-type N-terminal cleavage/methylation domain-containing protein